jgi:hypothetical protein
MTALEYEFELEGELEGELFASPQTLRRVGNAVAQTALRQGLSSIGLAEYETEGEWETRPWRAERILSPIRRVYPDAMMEHFGHAAAEAETEAEAEAFIGALIPLAARLIPRVAPAIIRSSPALLRGVAGITRTLRRNPATRQLVRTVPTIVRRTAADISRQARQGGGQVTPQQAVQALARQTRRVIANPQQAQRALARNSALDRRYHQTAQACQSCLAE